MASVPQVYQSYERSVPAAEAPGYCPTCGGRCSLRQVDGSRRAVCTSCGRVRYRNPAPGVAVVISDDERVLLVRRRAGCQGAGNWGLPAGFVEYDEDFLSAAHREAREETGLEIELTGLANLSSNFHHEGLHSLVGVVCARPVGGVLRPGDDVDATRWAPLRGPHPDLAFAGDRQALIALADGRLPLLPIDSRYRRCAP